jgi:putative endonuclease
MWYVYILESLKDHDNYVGLTDDLRERWEKHNQGKVISTKFRKPLKLIYYEAYLNKHDAANREQFLKTGWGKKWIKKNLKNYFKSKSKKLGG